MRLKMSAILLSILFANTAVLATPPTWVNGQSNRYPSGLYLVGVGQSDTRDKAKADAMASIAKIFRTRIEQQTTDWEKYVQIESRGKTNIEQKKSLESITKISNDKIVEGVQIVETAQDGLLYYALAIIDRLQATVSLSERMTDLDGNIREAIDQARNAPDKLSRIKNYKRAIKLSLTRDATNIDLQIVNVKGSGINAPNSLTQVAKEFDEWLAKNFLIDVKVTGTNGPAVQKAVIESLLQEGFPVNGEDAASSSPDLLVKGDVTLAPIVLPGKSFHYVRWCVELTILETKGSQIVGVISKSGREGHLSSSEAEVRAIRVLQPKVITDIGEQLAEYFTGAFQPKLKQSSSCTRAEK